MPLRAQSAGYEIQDTLVIKAQLGSILHLRIKIFSLHCDVFFLSLILGTEEVHCEGKKRNVI